MLKKMKRYAAAFVVTNSAGTFLELASLIPHLELQYVSMLSQVTLRALVSNVTNHLLSCCYDAHRTLWEIIVICMIIGSTFSATQYLLLETMEGPLRGDPFWIHVGLLITSFTVYGQPIHCYIWTRRKFGTPSKFSPAESLK